MKRNKHLKSHAGMRRHRIANKKVKKAGSRTAKQLTKSAAEYREHAAVIKTRRKMARGILRRGDQWVVGKNTYKKMKHTIEPEMEGKFLAIAQGGLDIYSETGETKEEFERRVAGLVSKHETYTPYIVLHKSQDAEEDEEDEEDEEEEEEDDDMDEEEGNAAGADEWPDVD